MVGRESPDNFASPSPSTGATHGTARHAGRADALLPSRRIRARRSHGATLDARLGLTDAEFRVEGSLVAIGPIYDVDALGVLVDELEQIGLVYFDDFFELSGSWPEWLTVLVRTPQQRDVYGSFVSSGDGATGVNGPRRSRPCQPHS